MTTENNLHNEIKEAYDAAFPNRITPVPSLGRLALEYHCRERIETLRNGGLEFTSENYLYTNFAGGLPIMDDGYHLFMEWVGMKRRTSNTKSARNDGSQK